MRRPWHPIQAWGLAMAIMSLVSSQPVIAGPAVDPVAVQGRLSALNAELTRLARANSGTVGVAALHLETGLYAELNSNVSFPMASTYKVAIAGAVLDQVDKGRLTLDQMIDIPVAMIIDSDGIAKDFPHVGISLSVANLIESMMVVSDNTATDVLLRLAGGTPAVTGWVHSQGVKGMRIDRSTAGIIKDFDTMEVQLNQENAAAMKAASTVLVAPGEEPNPQFDNDPRDTSTPTAMVQLLKRIGTGEALGKDSTRFILEVMSRCVTGEGRLVSMLPPGVDLAHKTGTIGGSVNDVGIMTLPENDGHIIIAVYIKSSSDPMGHREKLIAQIGRSVVDYMRAKLPLRQK